VRGVELAGRHPSFPRSLRELAVLGEFDDAGIGVAAVSVADENVAIGRDQDRGGRVERVWAVARRSGLAQREQDLAVGLNLKT
jgi:hypothetical protein